MNLSFNFLDVHSWFWSKLHKTVKNWMKSFCIFCSLLRYFVAIQHFQFNQIFCPESHEDIHGFVNERRNFPQQTSRVQHILNYHNLISCENRILKKKCVWMQLLLGTRQKIPKRKKRYFEKSIETLHLWNSQDEYRKQQGVKILVSGHYAQGDYAQSEHYAQT